MTQYIFDLYGTLIDIHTDETMPSLWKKMSGFFAAYGAVYTPLQLKEAYFRTVRDEEAKMPGEYPEIDLVRVFIRLRREAPAHCSPSFAADERTFAETAMTMFRITSRRRFRVYPHTREVLQKLKEQGHGIWLLSNAQAVFTVPEIVQSGLYDLFDGIYISSDHGVKKPAAEFLERLIRQYDLPKDECVMVGNDWTADIGMAYRYGIRAVYLNTAEETKEQLRTHLLHYRKNMVRAAETIAELIQEE
ncbi:MAG: HAD family hydrolase [Solobacterium sp.]|nr:HAD family hydrolase [Solobacterium sp.]